MTSDKIRFCVAIFERDTKSNSSLYADTLHFDEPRRWPTSQLPNDIETERTEHVSTLPHVRKAIEFKLRQYASVMNAPRRSTGGCAIVFSFDTDTDIDLEYPCRLNWSISCNDGDGEIIEITIA